ncbi:hypothetical protein ACN27J_11715 [Solwaraspora sp. WMMB762]|uniref:hypothetical protein n=1 Tax=Solwaraspora sp. WMMB762 TaxID=3404120 RepID=UPI003B954CBD
MVDDTFGGRRSAHQGPVDRQEPVDVTPDAQPTPGDGEGRGRGVRAGRGRRVVVIGSLAALGVLGVGLLGSTGLRIVAQKDASLSAPDEAAGLVRDDGEQARSTADYLHSAFAAGIDLDQSTAAVYRDPSAADRSVLVFGGTALLWSPEHDLDALLEIVGDEEGSVTGVHQVPAGTYGGVMKCGSTPTGDQEMPVCGWADHGSIAVALFPGRTVGESAALLADLRMDLQQRD